MKSCREYLSEIREKVVFAEDQLRCQKKNLYKTDELFTEEKEKWAKEIKEEQIRVHINEKDLKQKEERFEALKSEYEVMLKRFAELEGANDKIKKEIQRARKVHEDETNKYLFMTGTLEKELAKIQEQQKDTKIRNKWGKAFEEQELKVQEVENENVLKENIRLLSEEFAKKIEVFDDNLREIERSSLIPKQQKLKELQEALGHTKKECEDMERKNRELEEQIALIERLPAI